jgi:protein-S-isoprenylcysteine O-methyltransferase Ste14
MPESLSLRGWRTSMRWIRSTPKRTFVVYPLCVIALNLLTNDESIRVEPWGGLLLAWGFLQYRLLGHYRTRLGGGGPGPDVAPERLVVTGPYRYTRNPMYLGHLIFMLGLAITFRSWLALALLAFHAVWFHRRVLGDEGRLLALFGDEYARYMRSVKRWIPVLL